MGLETWPQVDTHQAGWEHAEWDAKPSWRGQKEISLQ